MSPPASQRDEDERVYTLFGAFSPFILALLLYITTEALDMKSQHYLLTLVFVPIMGIAFSFCLIRTSQIRETLSIR